MQSVTVYHLSPPQSSEAKSFRRSVTFFISFFPFPPPVVCMFRDHSLSLSRPPLSPSHSNDSRQHGLISHLTQSNDGVRYNVRATFSDTLSPSRLHSTPTLSCSHTHTLTLPHFICLTRTPHTLSLPLSLSHTNPLSPPWPLPLLSQLVGFLTHTCTRSLPPSFTRKHTRSMSSPP